jgi:uncharacterized membrane protein
MATQDTADSIAKLASPLRGGLIEFLTSRWWVAFALSSICVVGGHIAIKAGLNAAARTSHTENVLTHVLHLIIQPEVLIGLAVYMVGTLCWMLAVSQKEISFLYPLASVNYVLVALASAAFLAENLPPRRVMGIVLVVCGIAVLNRGRGRLRA